LFGVFKHSELDTRKLTLREIRSLTAIRGVAALYVMCHHIVLFMFLPSQMTRPIQRLYMGYSGVDIFFVLSGFILTTVYLDLTPGGLKDFALRRILRIYPLHLTVLAAMAGMTYFSIIWPANTADWRTLPEVALLVHPFFGITHGFWNGVTWSAGVEMSCYLLFPFALFLLRRLPIVAVALLVLAAGYTEWRFQVIHPDQWTGWLCVQRGWHGFALGMALGLLAVRVTVPRVLVLIVELAAVAVLARSILRVSLPPVPLAAGALIWMLGESIGPIARILSTGLFFFLGRISFSIYLIHYPLIDVFARLWPVGWNPQLNAMFGMREACYLAVLIGLSTLTNRWIEQPAQRFLRGKSIGKKRAVAGGEAQGPSGCKPEFSILTPDRIQ